MAITSPPKAITAAIPPAIIHGETDCCFFGLAIGGVGWLGIPTGAALTTTGLGPLMLTGVSVLVSGLAIGTAPLAVLLGLFTTACGPDFVTELPLTTGFMPELDFRSPGRLSSDRATGNDF